METFDDDQKYERFARMFGFKPTYWNHIRGGRRFRLYEWEF